MFKKIATVVGAAVPFLPALALAEGTGTAPTVAPIVDPSSIQSTIITSATPWVLAGIGVAISVLLVFLGWKWIRKFMGR